MLEKLRFFSLLRKLGKDEDASILLQFTVYTVAIFGMIGLALDGGRYLLLNNDLQDLADASALAGAVTLDGTNGARSRATTAAQSFLSNDTKWSEVSIGTPPIASVSFYSCIKGAAGCASDVAANSDSDASFIKVTTNAGQVAPTFLGALNINSSSSTSASATAGVSYAACVPIQSYVCGANFPSATNTGTMFTLLASGSGGSGNWGIMDLPAGMPDFKAYFSALPSAVCNAQKVDQRTGNGQHKDIIAGVNVRFDQSAGNNASYTNIAGPIVIDGQSNTGSGNSCNRPGATTPKNTKSIPGFDPDTNYTVCNQAGYSCPLPRTAGTANVNLNAYWQNHHGANWPTDPTSGLPITRYQAYLQEIAMTGAWATDGVEPHAPACLPVINDSSRRVLSVALLDTCPSGNSGGPFVFTKYANFFVTEDAVLVTGQPQIQTEYITTYTANGPNSKLHQIVQLVR